MARRIFWKTEAHRLVCHIPFPESKNSVSLTAHLLYEIYAVNDLRQNGIDQDLCFLLPFALYFALVFFDLTVPAGTRDLLPGKVFLPHHAEGQRLQLLLHHHEL